MISPIVDYQGMFNSLFEGVQIIDFNWRYIYLNDVTTNQGKIAKEELLGETMMAQYPGIEDTPLFIQPQRIDVRSLASSSAQTEFDRYALKR